MNEKSIDQMKSELVFIPFIIGFSSHCVDKYLSFVGGGFWPFGRHISIVCVIKDPETWVANNHNDVGYDRN
jgi:hypothetical protein